jgi:lipopolysaccharide/colanic/teichoic acid biosynthesis glycosyltransferase
LKPKFSEISKRAIDIVGSITGLLLFSPVFFFAFIFIPLTSKGPVFFKQNRVGKGGRIFKIFKLRTMFISNDESLHRNYVTNFIRGESVSTVNNSGKEIYKLTNDNRITAIGKFLRKTSLDEIPQFINVLLGDMSLVGPRPPIPYEVSEYQLWHCCRLQCKPGITGYWQIEGRSRTNFDNMVRMDINYVNKKSLLLDLMMIFKTPFVLISSKGAY